MTAKERFGIIRAVFLERSHAAFEELRTGIPGAELRHFAILFTQFADQHIE